MAFDLNNFVIDRIIRGVALSQKDDSVLFSINQIQNASLNCASESTDAVDAMGTPIATFYRAKSAEFSAENALFDMQLMATQLGTSKKVASAAEKITVPAMESFTVEAGETEGSLKAYTLKHTPKAASEYVYKLVKSAAANAEHNFGMDPEKLYVSECYVCPGPTLKRMMPRAKGSGDRILKRTSHITLVVKEKEVK
jgi:large subunit ribosomal protein L22